MSVLDLGYRHLARPVLFRLGDGESAHLRTVTTLAWMQRYPALLRPMRKLFAANAEPRELFGLRFHGPVGLAAGADKDGLALHAWPALGFGFVEAGTVTAHPQPGNPRPRVFRLIDSQAVINRMGFPNAGAAALADCMASSTATLGPVSVPVGISLGKSKIVDPDDREAVIADYLAALTAVRARADYLAVNVSSPNTPGLRGLQDRDTLDELVAALVRAAGRLGDDHHDDGHRGHRAALPILVKIAPDLDDHAVADVLQVCHDRGAAGVIATNTTVGRPGIAPGDRGLAMEPGGLSGAPLTARALDVVRFVTAHTDLPVIGVGGILRPDDAAAMFDAGAALVQIYTGMLYRGPGLIRAINRGAAHRRTVNRQERP